MSFYHVTITSKVLPEKKEAKLDLSSAEVESRFVDPYKRGNPVTINGKTIADIDRITVHRTEQSSADLRPLLKAKEAAARAAGAIFFAGLPLSTFVTQVGEDVTDEFITGPIGWASEPISDVSQELKPEKDVREVFVVHGRNNAARNALFDFLNAIDLHPLEWSEAIQATGKGSPYVGEVLDVVFSRAHAVVVLFTPDDEARLKESLRAADDPPHETQLTGQARPNVLFEAGMAMARNQDRTVLVELGRLRPFSDLGGRHVIRLDNSSPSRQDLAQRLETAGCPVKLKGAHWYTAGDFEAAVAHFVEAGPEPMIATKQEIPTEEGLEFPQEIQDLLIEATEGSGATINRLWRGSQLKVATNNRYFCNSQDTRETAKWDYIIQELAKRDFIEDSSGQGQVFRVTYEGLKYADRLKGQQD